ncbi:MAG: glucokinase [Bacteroidetes bacterium HGW-Bacteroidetes-21]|jgi:glucokinase|nr:MAG: glucokinase [Bacteroidetes bacterium HGW-Bacteroidetes-21]
MKEYIWGIDIGGTNTVCGLVDTKGNVLKECSFKTRDFDNPKDFVNHLSSNAKKTMDLLNPDEKVIGVGVGAPNGNYYTGNIEFAPNLTWEGIVPLAQMIEQAFNLPVKLTNDANAAALGEAYFGGAKGLSDFIMITIGTGLGSAFVANHNLIYGHDGFAGEMGHMNAIPDGRQCSCGLKGCLEEYVSSRGIIQTMNELIQQASKKDQDFWNDKTLDTITIYEEAIKSNPLAAMTFEITGTILGINLARVVTITSPSHIFLFGGIVKAGDLLLKPAIENMNKNLLPIFRDKVKIEISQLQDKNAAILGAAALMLNDLKGKK